MATGVPPIRTGGWGVLEGCCLEGGLQACDQGGRHSVSLGAWWHRDPTCVAHRGRSSLAVLCHLSPQGTLCVFVARPSQGPQ